MTDGRMNGSGWMALAILVIAIALVAIAVSVGRSRRPDGPADPR
jgi:hypothetical protein